MLRWWLNVCVLFMLLAEGAYANELPIPYVYTRYQDANGYCNEIGSTILHDVQISGDQVTVNYAAVAGCDSSYAWLNMDFIAPDAVISNVYSEQVSYTVDLYHPVLMISSSHEGLVGQALSAAGGGNPVVVPAVFFRYLKDKENQTIADKALEVVSIIIDVVSIPVGGSLLLKAVKAGRYIAAAYEGAQLIGATGNIVANMAGPEYSQFVNGYNSMVLGWGLLRSGTVVRTWKNIFSGVDEVGQFKQLTPTEAADLVAEYDQLKAAGKIQDEAAWEGLIGRLRGGGSAGRFIAASGAELENYLNGLVELPVGVSYSGNMYRSLSKYSEANFGALPDKMTDHTVYSTWGRYDLDGVENAMYLSKSLSGNQTEITHYGNWLDYNTYEFKAVQLNNLLDLSDDIVRQKLGTQFDDLVRTLGDNEINYEMTNVLASWARQKGYNGIIAPGARGAMNYENIILFEQLYIDDILEGIAPQKIIK